MCGIVGIVPTRGQETRTAEVDVLELHRLTDIIERHLSPNCFSESTADITNYLGGEVVVEELSAKSRALKTDAAFYRLLTVSEDCLAVESVAARLKTLADLEDETWNTTLGLVEAAAVPVLSRRLEKVRDIWWCLEKEVRQNLTRISELVSATPMSFEALALLRKINATFNSLDRLEVRGRDSAGIAVMVTVAGDVFESFQESLAREGLWESFKERSNPEILDNQALSFYSDIDNHQVSLAFVYKFAAEIGSLGENVRFLRKQISRDAVFQAMLGFPCEQATISAHTRWASVGTITEANCHPVDNRTLERDAGQRAFIQVCLNGDIDNYQELKAEHEVLGDVLPADITTDTKIIPVRIQKYLSEGHAVEEAFRLAVADFHGAHAIMMQTALAPGRLFFAQKGSGQALFVGRAQDHYIVSSELYGIIEETDTFLKMNADGHGRAGDSGQIIILDQETVDLTDITAGFYDGEPTRFNETHVNHTEITSRDVDRQEYPHYFLKEISQAPRSIEKTMQNCWQQADPDSDLLAVHLGDSVIPATLRTALEEGLIRRICFIGQGTAGVAALACSDILNYYLADPAMVVGALKASELSGFKLSESRLSSDQGAMADTLVVAISQSGTTTDTNRALDMVRDRGAHTLAIVNRRDSDITFRVDGVFYTSTGRDIEMSVASTKAFYSQVVAGSVLGLYLAELKGAREAAFISSEIKQLLRLPAVLTTIFEKRAAIQQSARRLAAAKTYWAVVGSGPNKAAADEIRIKLSELCYKTISSDYVEDKKHIDLSAEPLILVCAAGSRPRVLDDIVKDTAIFRAHKAAPVVIVEEGEDRFAPYAEDVIHVPAISEHFGPIVNTFVGHLWGYYAALAINDGSQLLYDFRENMRREIDQYLQQGLDLFEIVLENDFREKVLRFYKNFRMVPDNGETPSGNAQASDQTSDLTLLLKYLAGRLPLADFELDFGVKGTAPNMIKTLFACLSRSINQMARPIDAIKHQAKTVTVGTSRIEETMTGILFDALENHGISFAQLTNSNVVVLKNVQEIVAAINGSILYEVSHLNLLGAPTGETTIRILKKEGLLAEIPSRVETDSRLKGTKRIIVKEGNVYVGKGRKDDRHIVVIPVLSASTAEGGMINRILLLTIDFKERTSLYARKKALGGKCERIKNYVQENNVVWEDRFLELVDIRDLFGRSAEKNAEAIVAAVEKKS